MINKDTIDLLKSRKYLIVESDTALLQIIEITFKKLGISFYTAYNSKEAMELIDSVYIDCLIIDLNIPETNGIELCREIHKKYNKPVIIMSGTYDNMIVKAADNAGVMTFLYKPLNLVDLFELLILIKYDNYKTPTKNLTRYIV